MMVSRIIAATSSKYDLQACSAVCMTAAGDNPLAFSNIFIIPGNYVVSLLLKCFAT